MSTEVPENRLLDKEVGRKAEIQHFLYSFLYTGPPEANVLQETLP